MPKSSPMLQLALASAAVGTLVTALLWQLPLSGSPEAAAGKPAPALVGRTTDGRAWDLASLRDKRAALVVFWASW